MNRHWTLDELIDRSYGIRDEDEHLASCGQCASRLEELKRYREVTCIGTELTAGELAAQRAVVRSQIESPVHRVPAWIPATTAAACLLAVAMFVYRPAQIVHPVAETAATATAVTNDAQLFADIYNVEESAEPRAAAPIHELFQEGQQ